MSSRPARERSIFMQAVMLDNSLPMDRQAVDLWMRDLENPARWIIRPILQFILAVMLHVTWALKRLPLPQFRAHGVLQRTICWFCRNFVSPEANQLILRHFATESNILNFLRDNSGASSVAPVELYPRKVDDMLRHTFVDHDQELFRAMREMSPWQRPESPKPPSQLDWSHWRDIDIPDQGHPRRWAQGLDFETSHALFMCFFCFLLTAEEYRDAINGFNLDHSIAIRIGQIVGDPTLVELAYNKYPHYLVGPWNLTQRFLMHGFFTEYLHARLEELRASSGQQAAIQG